MERGSSKHSPRLDEQMEFEVRGMVQGIAGSRIDEARMPEPAGEDQPEVTEFIDSDTSTGRAEETPDGLSRFGRYIGLSALPGDREALMASAETLNAPDDVLDRLERLPDGVTYRNVAEAWRASRSEA
jgi:hypothetical protein